MKKRKYQLDFLSYFRFLILISLICYFDLGCIPSSKQYESPLVIQYKQRPVIFYVDTWVNKSKSVKIKYNNQYRILPEWAKSKGMIINYPFDLPDNFLKEVAEDNTLIIYANKRILKKTIYTELLEKNININNVKIIFTKNKLVNVNSLPINFISDSSNIKMVISRKINKELNKIKNFNFSNKLINNITIKKIKTNAILNSNSILYDGIGRLYIDYHNYSENVQNKSLKHFNNHIKDYFGIKELIYFPLLDNDHLRNNLKLLDTQRILIKSPEVRDSKYLQLEQSRKVLNLDIRHNNSFLKVEEFKEFVHNKTETSYINSLIFNDKVFVPFYGTKYDSIAQKRWQELMPSHKIIGCILNKNQRQWAIGDAIVQRVVLIH